MKTLIVPLALVALAACKPAEMPQPRDGRALYDANCAICHGVSGQGDGPAASGLDPQPADLTSITRRSGGDFPVAQVLSTIDGYTRAPVAGVNMPEFGLLLQGDLVPVDTGDGVLSPVPRPLAALLAYLQAIQAEAG